jgi:hypothetical protein
MKSASFGSPHRHVISSCTSRAEEKNVTHPTIGIDIGRYKLDVGIPPAHNKIPIPQYPTVHIDLRQLDWWQTLLDLIAPEAVVTAESTGFHLLAPIARLINQHRPAAQLYEVQGKATANMRQQRVSKNAKTDRLDAISLYLIAECIARGEAINGVKPYDHAHESAVQALRLHHNAYFRLDRDSVRIQNRMTVMARSIAPVADQWFGSFTIALRAGLRTRDDVDAYIAIKPRKRRDYLPALLPGELTNLTRLLNAMPPIPFDPTTIGALVDLLSQQDDLTRIQVKHYAEMIAIIQRPPLAHITRRWMTMPGYTPQWLAALHVATHGQADQITRDQFCAAVGVAPATAQTGESDTTRLNKKGYRPARAAMHLWTLGLLSPTAKPNRVRDYFEAKEGRHMGAAKTKLARILWGRANDPLMDDAPLSEAAAAADLALLSRKRIDPKTGEIIE